MTKDEKFQIGMALNKIALSLSDEDFHKVKEHLKCIEKIVAEQTEFVSTILDTDYDDNRNGYAIMIGGKAEQTEPNLIADTVKKEWKSWTSVGREPTTEDCSMVAENCDTCEHKDNCEGATYEYKNTQWWCLGYKPQTDCPQSNICGKPCKECGACEEECGLWKKLKTEPQTDYAWGRDG